MIRVVLADDHHLVRKGIRALLEKDPDIAVVGEAQDGREAVSLVQRLRPDVLIVDIAMPGLNGIEATQQVRTLGLTTQTVILSMHCDETLVRQTLKHGARGYLLKTAAPQELVSAIHTVSRRGIYLSPEAADLIADDILASLADSEPAGPLDRLAPREREVLQLIAEGHTNVEMAKLMRVSVSTVEKHRRRLMKKLGIYDVPGLTLAALRLGLIALNDYQPNVQETNG